MRERRYRLEPVYFSAVVVHAGHSARTFEDLFGARFAFNERISHSGYGEVRHALAMRGYTSGFFRSIVASVCCLCRNRTETTWGRVACSFRTGQMIRASVARACGRRSCRAPKGFVCPSDNGCRDANYSCHGRGGFEIKIGVQVPELNYQPTPPFSTDAADSPAHDDSRVNRRGAVGPVCWRVGPRAAVARVCARFRRHRGCGRHRRGPRCAAPVIRPQPIPCWPCHSQRRSNCGSRFRQSCDWRRRRYAALRNAHRGRRWPGRRTPRTSDAL